MSSCIESTSFVAPPTEALRASSEPSMSTRSTLLESGCLPSQRSLPMSSFTFPCLPSHSHAPFFFHTSIFYVFLHTSIFHTFISPTFIPHHFCFYTSLKCTLPLLPLLFTFFLTVFSLYLLLSFLSPHTSFSHSPLLIPPSLIPLSYLLLSFPSHTSFSHSSLLIPPSLIPLSSYLLLSFPSHTSFSHSSLLIPPSLIPLSSYLLLSFPSPHTSFSHSPLIPPSLIPLSSYLLLSHYLSFVSTSFSHILISILSSLPSTPTTYSAGRHIFQSLLFRHVCQQQTGGENV